MYLFESSSASNSDARPYSYFTASGTQAVASTDSTVALHHAWGGAGDVGERHEIR